MNFKKRVQDYLEADPRFRLRSNKNKGIVNILQKKYPILQNIERDFLVEVVKDYASMDRAWRQILEKNKSLRGADYGDKEELEDKKLAELGYKTNEEK